MTLQQIQCLAAVAENASFTKAAEQLYSSQSAVSLHINTLENELGFPLLNRGGKQVSLTPEGGIFLTECVAGIARLDNAVVLAKRAHQGFDGHLRIGCISPINPEPIFSQVLERFKDDHPNIEMTVELNERDILLSKLKSDELDLFFTVLFSVSNEKEIITLPIRKGKRVLIMGRKHPLAKLEKIDIRDCAFEQFIAIDPHAGGYKGLKNVLEYYQLSPEILLVPNIDTLLLYVRLGIGVAVVDDNIKDIDHPALVYKELHLEVDDGLSYLVAAWRGGSDNPSLKTFLDILQKFKNI